MSEFFWFLMLAAFFTASLYFQYQTRQNSSKRIETMRAENAQRQVEAREHSEKRLKEVQQQNAERVEQSRQIQTKIVEETRQLQHEAARRAEETLILHREQVELMRKLVAQKLGEPKETT